MPAPDSNPPEPTPGKTPKPAKAAGRGLMSWVFILGLMIVLFAVMQSSGQGPRDQELAAISVAHLAQDRAPLRAHTRPA